MVVSICLMDLETGCGSDDGISAFEIVVEAMKGLHVFTFDDVCLANKYDENPCSGCHQCEGLIFHKEHGSAVCLCVQDHR